MVPLAAGQVQVESPPAPGQGTAVGRAAACEVLFAVRSRWDFDHFVAPHLTSWSLSRRWPRWAQPTLRFAREQPLDTSEREGRAATALRAISRANCRRRSRRSTRLPPRSAAGREVAPFDLSAGIA